MRLELFGFIGLVLLHRRQTEIPARTFKSGTTLHTGTGCYRGITLLQRYCTPLQPIQVQGLAFESGSVPVIILRAQKQCQ